MLFRNLVIMSLAVIGGLLTGCNRPADGAKELVFDMPRSKQNLGEVNTQYLLQLPKDYDKDKTKQWPLILFLHGSGERGNDISKVKWHGPPHLVAKGRDLPFIVVSPQCPSGKQWVPVELAALLDQVESQYRVDTNREYCTGLSMGGFGTWALATEFPQRFAAIAPICGGGDPKNAGRIASLPIWVFHGAKDDDVPIACSQAMVDALRQAGGNPAFTIYPEAEHNSWTATYADERLFQWFLANRRGQAPVPPPSTQPAK
jgi:predicted peptidase